MAWYMPWLVFEPSFKAWNSPLNIAKVAYNDYIDGSSGCKLEAPWAI